MFVSLDFVILMIFLRWDSNVVVWFEGTGIGRIKVLIFILDEGSLANWMI